MKFTVLGASGYIGSAVAKYIRSLEIACDTPPRNGENLSANLGHVIYCIGITADFRKFPLETVQAHVCKLIEILKNGRFDSLLYLSSTRVYGGADVGIENTTFSIAPQNPGDIYNISKLMGEALCYSSGLPVKIVRISNVYGSDFDSPNFLPSIIRDAVIKKHISLTSSLESAKDYIFIDDVVTVIPKIVLEGAHAIYNIASSENVTNMQLLAKIQELTGCSVTVSPNAPTVSFPKIDISAIKNELGFTPVPLLSKLPELIFSIQERFS